MSASPFDEDQLNPYSSDASLVHQLRMGNPDAYEALVKVYGARLIRYAARITGSSDTAQEVVQDVFLQLWTGRRELTQDLNVSTYLYWLVRNRSINTVKSHASATQRDLLWTTEHKIRTSSNAPSAAESLEAELEAAEIRAQVWDALQTATPRAREIFMLVWDKQLRYDEVAQTLGLSVTTVRSQMSRALRKVLEILGPRFARDRKA